VLVEEKSAVQISYSKRISIREVETIARRLQHVYINHQTSDVALGIGIGLRRS
jgi:hypothetical protein